MMKAMPGSRADDAAHDSPPRRLRAVCATGDPGLRCEIALALARDFEVIHAPDGVAALQAAHEQLPELIVLDLAVRRIPFAELLTAIRVDARTRSTPVIVVGESTGAERSYDADDYLARPFTASDLVDLAYRHILLRQAERAQAIERERERAAHALAEADAEGWRRATQEVALLAEVERRELTRELLELTPIARRIATALQARAPARRVDVRVADGLVVVADRELVTIALEQLLENAWKFTRRRALAEIVVESPHPGVFLVRDNGAGFDMAGGEQLFRPYRRLHPDSEFEGLGIGLAIVRRVVERHNGESWAHGQVDRGATVWFTLGADSEPPG
jgi:signal transduction histidine kinase